MKPHVSLFLLLLMLPFAATAQEPAGANSLQSTKDVSTPPFGPTVQAPVGANSLQSTNNVPMAPFAAATPVYSLQGTNNVPMVHSFMDMTNLRIQGINVVSQTFALLAIQSHDDGGGMAHCSKPPCEGALEARGRTLDPFEKHFESYGYGWGSVYRYAGGVGLNLAVSYAFHATGHHKLEHWAEFVAIGHADASIGYALTGSKQGKYGW